MFNYKRINWIYSDLMSLNNVRTIMERDSEHLKFRLYRNKTPIGVIKLDIVSGNISGHLSKYNDQELEELFSKMRYYFTDIVLSEDNGKKIIIEGKFNGKCEINVPKKVISKLQQLIKTY